MRVLLADDQVKVRFALRVLLERQPDVAVVGEASDARELVDQLAATRPDALLLDWELPGLAATRCDRCVDQELPGVDRDRVERSI